MAPRSSSRHRDRSRGDKSPQTKGTTVWVGGLPQSIGEEKLRNVFGRYGRILDIRMKIGNGGAPPFAFVEYAHGRDAQDAVRGMDQSSDFGNAPVKVSMSNSCESTGAKGGKGFGEPRGRRFDSRGRKGRGDSRKGFGKRHDSRRRNDSRRRKGGFGRSNPAGGKGFVRVGDFKITIENLPNDMTWTELKEMGKQYVTNGELTFARTFKARDGTACGMLEFKDREDADCVVTKLDGKKIKGHDQRLVVRHGDAGRGR